MKPNEPDIEITIATQYLSEESNPDKNQFIFAYTVTLTNHGEETIQLLNRYWRITDANNKIKEVHGDGVIGQQPHIAHGESFQYTSGAMIETKAGTMEGHYGVTTADGYEFKAPIPLFTLADPATLH